MDYYGLLEINRNATDREINESFRHLALKYHPKRKLVGPLAEGRFAAICEAYDVLSNPDTRSLYDQFGERAMKKGVLTLADGTEEKLVDMYTYHGDSMRVFREFFGSEYPVQEIKTLKPSPIKIKPAETIEETFTLSLVDAFFGTTKCIDLDLRVVDDTGTKTEIVTKPFTFRVPKGTPNGQCFVFKAAGNSSLETSPGDVHFIADIEPNSEFNVEDHDLVVHQSVHLADALLGCTIDVKTIDGKEVHIPVTDVLKPKDRICIKNEGLPILGEEGRGDLLIEMDIEFPEKLTEEQKAFIRQAFVEETPEDVWE